MLRPLSAFLASSIACVSIGMPLSAQAPTNGLTVIALSGRNVIQTLEHDGREMVALEDLARLFRLDLREDSRAGTLSVLHGDDVIILTPNQQLVSVAGRLVSLAAGPQRVRGQWVVPLDFLNRALAPIYGERLEFRQRARLILIGDVLVPRVSAQYRALAGAGQLTLEVTPDTPHTVDEDANRLVVTFHADGIDVERLPRPRGDLVTAFRHVETPPGLAIDLGSTFDSFSVASALSSTGGTELVIELRSLARGTADATPPAPVAPPPVSDTTPADPLPDFTTARSVRVVAIDPGHGGDDHGSQGADGQLEKDITLSVARRLQSVLEGRLGMRVVPTRTRDQTVGLDERAAIANNNAADLFISLHVNASARPSATGAEVFYLSLDEYGAEARELAREGIRVPLVGGGSRAIDLVLWEMAQVRYVDQSARAAEIVAEELRRRVPMGLGTVQQAPFRVLVGANMPAVLVELGSISDPADERRLTGTGFRNNVVEALVASVLRFRDYLERSSRTAGGTDSTAATALVPSER